MMYPLKFKPILKPILWGGDKICQFKNIYPREAGIGESWEISQVKSDVSVVANGTLADKTLTDLISEYKDQLLGKSVWERFGEKFPLLIKFIDARDNLSIQVHPDDVLAKARHNSFGKTEMWYVISAEEGAGLYSGFSQQITPEEYVKRVNENTIMEVLQFHPVKSGDVFFLPAGRVHAIGKGIFIAEIQQTSDITYRIYDYNRKDAQGNSRELHTELAKDAIDYTLSENYKTDYGLKPNVKIPLISCDYFTSSFLELDQSTQLDIRDKDSFIIYICIAGKGTIRDNNGCEIDVEQGDTVLIPACIDKLHIEPCSTIKLLESYIK